MEVANYSSCSVHAGKELNIVCLDTNCRKPALICLICLKNDHNNCDDSKVMGIEEFKHRMEIKESGSDLKVWKDQIWKMLDKNEEKLQNALQAKKLSILDGFSPLTKSTDMCNIDVIKSVKNNFNITVDDGEKVIISSKLEAPTYKIEKGLELFQKSLDRRTNKFIEDMNNLNFYVTV